MTGIPLSGLRMTGVFLFWNPLALFLLFQFLVVVSFERRVEALSFAIPSPINAVITRYFVRARPQSAGGMRIELPDQHHERRPLPTQDPYLAPSPAQSI